MKRKPLVYLPEAQGGIGPLPSGDILDVAPTFSFHKIKEGLKLTIPEDQQMSVEDGIELYGELVIIGSLILR